MNYQEFAYFLFCKMKTKGLEKIELDIEKITTEFLSIDKKYGTFTVEDKKQFELEIKQIVYQDAILSTDADRELNRKRTE